MDGDGERLADAYERHLWYFPRFLRALEATGWVIGGPLGAAARLRLKLMNLFTKVSRDNNFAFCGLTIPIKRCPLIS